MLNDIVYSETALYGNSITHALTLSFQA